MKFIYILLLSVFCFVSCKKLGNLPEESVIAPGDGIVGTWVLKQYIRKLGSVTTYQNIEQNPEPRMSFHADGDITTNYRDFKYNVGAYELLDNSKIRFYSEADTFKYIYDYQVTEGGLMLDIPCDVTCTITLVRAK